MTISTTTLEAVNGSPSCAATARRPSFLDKSWQPDEIGPLA